MKDKEKKMLKDSIINIFENFNVLDHTATIGGLRDGVLKCIDSLQEEPVSEDLEEASKNYALNNTPWDDCKDEIQESFKAGVKWQKQKDSIISEDLEKASKEWLAPQLDKSYANYGEAMMMELTHFDGYAMLDAIEYGAKWQKEKEYTCYEEAFEDGAKWKKEEMMKDAVDVTVHIEAGNYPYIPQIELYDYDKDVPLANKGDKVKVIIIKENKDE